jgi:hypothetical protein
MLNGIVFLIVNVEAHSPTRAFPRGRAGGPLAAPLWARLRRRARGNKVTCFTTSKRPSGEPRKGRCWARANIFPALVGCVATQGQNKERWVRPAYRIMKRPRCKVRFSPERTGIRPDSAGRRPSKGVPKGARGPCAAHKSSKPLKRVVTSFPFK